MTKPEERMDMISSAIRSQAEQQARELTKKATAYQSTEVFRYTESVIEEMYAFTQHAITESKRESLGNISTEEKEGMRSLLRQRQELTDSMFAQVRARLAAYAETPAYRESIIKSLTELKTSYDHTYSTVLLREADVDLTESVKALLPGCTVRADASVRIGGFILTNTAARILIDETLEDRLTQQMEWFLEHCQLRIH